MALDPAWLRRTQFPLAAEAVYLNHAAAAPIPTCTAEALHEYVGSRQHPNRLYRAGGQEVDEAALRAALCRLLGCAAHELALVASTSAGLATAVAAVGWQSGDNVLVCENEFPAVSLSAYALAQRGVEVRVAPAPAGLPDLEQLLGRIDRRTRAVVISHVNWSTGARVDLARLGAACRAAGVVSIVDGIQSLGVLPVSPVDWQIDVWISGAYKWLLGVPGVAVLFISHAVWERLTPPRSGYVGLADPFCGAPPFAWQPGALQYQGGQLNPGAALALQTSLGLIEAVGGPAAIGPYVLELCGRLVGGLQDLGVAVTSPAPAEQRGSILSFTLGSVERDEACRVALLAEGIVVSRRQHGLRAAPHLYNTAAEIDRLLERIATYVRA